MKEILLFIISEVTRVSKKYTYDNLKYKDSYVRNKI